MLRTKTSTILFHTVGWVLLFGLFLAFSAHRDDAMSTARAFRPAFLAFMAVYLFVFYANAYWLMPRLYLRQRYGLYFLAVGLMLLGIVFLKPFEHLMHMGPGGLAGHRPPPIGHRPRGGGPGGRPLIDITSIILFLMVWAWSAGMQILQQWRALQAEAEKAQAELASLKAQIHPHFLFNTLNNIYSLAITKSERTPEAILKLSNILRYVTDEAAEDFVPLQHEVACIGDYIDLQRLRLGEKTAVEFSVEGPMET